MIKLAAFDLSGTITHNSMLGEAPAFVGNGKEAERLLAAYHNHEMNAEELTRKVVALWKGFDSKDFPKVYSEIKWFEGVPETLAEMKKRGIRLILISASPTPLLEFIAEKMGFDEFYGTDCEVKEGKFTGKILRMFPKKEDALKQAAEKAGVKLSECMAVGDSRVDEKMIAIAGVGVAFEGKRKTGIKAKHQISEFRELLKRT